MPPRCKWEQGRWYKMVQAAGGFAEPLGVGGLEKERQGPGAETGLQEVM